MTDTTAELRAPTEGKCDPDLMLKMATGTGLTTVTIIGVGPDGNLRLWGSDDSTAASVLLLERAKLFFMKGYPELD